MDQPYATIFTLDAVQDLESAFDWIKDYSLETAKDFVIGLRCKCEVELATTPRMGVQLELASGTFLYALTNGQYRIFYGVNGETRTVTIFRILHTSRDISRILKLVA